MIQQVREDLSKIKKDRPGRRFQNEHRRARKNGADRGWVRIVSFALAAVFAAIGVVLVFIPGPAFVFFILTGAVLASQWMGVARFLDKSEVWLARRWRQMKRRWQIRGGRKRRQD